MSVSLSEFAYFMRFCAGSTSRSVRMRPVSGGEAPFIAVRPHSVQAGCVWGSCACLVISTGQMMMLVSAFEDTSTQQSFSVPLPQIEDPDIIGNLAYLRLNPWHAADHNLMYGGKK